MKIKIAILINDFFFNNYSENLDFGRIKFMEYVYLPWKLYTVGRVNSFAF